MISYNLNILEFKNWMSSAMGYECITIGEILEKWTLYAL